MSTSASIAAAIAQMENVNPAYNNPGGVVDPSGKLIHYATYSEGENAMLGILNRHSNLTLEQLFGGQRDANGNVIPGGYPGYSPAQAGNDPVSYAAFVSSQTGIPLSTPIANASGGGGDSYASVTAIPLTADATGYSSDYGYDYSNAGSNVDPTTVAMIGVGALILGRMFFG